MTKDGHPSRINDIRYFFGDKHTYLDGQEEAVAFGRRIAWFLNGEGFSLGAYPSLYIYFTTSLAPGAVEVTDYGGDWWERYTHIDEAGGRANIRGSATLGGTQIVKPKSQNIDLKAARSETTKRPKKYSTYNDIAVPSFILWSIFGAELGTCVRHRPREDVRSGNRNTCENSFFLSLGGLGRMSFADPRYRRRHK